MITIFTDGSARGNPGPGGYGAVISYKLEVGSKLEDLVTELGGHAPHTTNNRMELTAVIRALEFVSNLKLETSNIKLFTDSEYIVKGITSWVKSWQQNNWKTAARKPVLNQDLWEQMIAVTEGKDIKWSVVPGHSGVLANERCDEIATAFADSTLPIMYKGPREGYTVSLALHAEQRS